MCAARHRLFGERTVFAALRHVEKGSGSVSGAHAVKMSDSPTTSVCEDTIVAYPRRGDTAQHSSGEIKNLL